MFLSVISKKSFDQTYKSRKIGVFSLESYGVVEAEYTGSILHRLTPSSSQTDVMFPDFDSIIVPGTVFQAQVWAHLLTIEQGKTCSYSDVATAIGNPKASRAVGQAVGANPVGILIPCHRVLAKDGKIGGFSWGQDLKKKWLSIEQI